MYTPLNTLNTQEHDKTRVYNSQNDMRGLLINHYASQMDQRYGTSSSADSERIAQMAHEQRMSRIQTPMEQRPVLDQRRDIYEQHRTDHLKQASQMEQDRTEHMKRLLEKQEQERIDRTRLHTPKQGFIDKNGEIQRINDQVDVIKAIYTKKDERDHNAHQGRREHYRDQDLGPAVNQLIDLLNSFKLSNTTLTHVADNYNPTDLSNYATLASPSFTGTPTTTTPSYTDNSTRIPTTSWVNYVIEKDLENYVTVSGLNSTLPYYVLGTTLSNYAQLESPSFTGTPTTTTPSYTDNSTRIPTTSWVISSLESSLYDYATIASPSFTGTPTTTTPSYIDNSTRIPTTSWVNYVINYVIEQDLANYVTTSSFSSLSSSVSSLSSSLSSTYVPYSGATSALNMGTQNISSSYVPTVGSDVLNKTFGDATYATISNLALKANLASPTFTGTVSGITKAMVGLGNVDNTSDVNKPVSTATQTALNLKSNLASPTFTGTVTLPSVSFTSTPSLGSGTLLAINGSGNLITTTSSINQTSTSTTGTYYMPFVASSATGTFYPLVYSTLMCDPDTGLITASRLTASDQMTTYNIQANNLTETFSMKINNVTAGTNSKILAVNSGNYVIEASTTGTTGSSVVLSTSPALTGTPTAPTATAGTNTTQIATTAFVTTAVAAVGIPTQINATAINTSVSLYPAWFQSTAGGSSTVYVETDGSLFYNPLTNRLTSSIVSASSTVETPTVQNSSGQTVTINAQNGAIAGNRINLQIQSTNYYYFDKDAFYLTQPSNNVISSITNDLYFLWPSGKLLSLNNWATFDNTGFFMAGTRKIQSQTFETQSSQNLTLNVPTATNLINFNFNGNTRARVTDYGFWLPVDGSRSIYMTDTAPYGSSTTYGRLFGVSGAIYQDFYNQFIWRRDPGLTGTGVAELMSLNSNGLTLQNATALGQPQLTFAGSGIPTIKANGNGINWSINGGNSGYFDMNAWSAGYGWRINANHFMTMQCAYDMVIQCKVGGVPQSGANNRYIQIVTPNSVNSVNDIGGNGWYSGACVFRAQEYNGNLGGGIGISMSSYPAYGGNNWGYVTCVEPGTAWRNWAFGGSTAQWYVNGTMCAYINSTSGWQAASDARVKRDIQDLNTKKSLQRILKCKPKHYKRIIKKQKGEHVIPLKQEDIDRVQIGLLAQDVLEINPHCVSTWEDEDQNDTSKKVERYGVAYQDFIIHLIGSVQEQQHQINTLEKTVEKQHIQIQAQQVKIEEHSTTINALTETVRQLSERLNALTMAFNQK